MRARSDEIPVSWKLAAGLGGIMLAVGARALVRRSYALDLCGATVLITGGSRGLGLVMARQLAARGARVAICSRDEAQLERARAELSSVGPPVAAVRCDLTNPHELRELVTRVRDTLGPIDVLINNAGLMIASPMQHQDEADYHAMMDTTFWAAKRLTDLVLPDMRQRGGGRIVNISSIGGLIPAPHMASYVAAKHALLGYSRAMRIELARENIFVTTVAPGLMRTGSPPNVAVKGNAPAEYAWFKISDSLPLTSMSADRAAANIIDAMAHGDAELQLTLSAKLASRLYALFPNTSARLGGLINRALPDPVGDRPMEPVQGREVETPVTLSPLGALTDRAALRNNEL